MPAILPLALALGFMAVGLAQAAQAVFSPDGSTLWAMSRYRNVVLRFKSGAKEPTLIEIPKVIFEHDYEPTQIAWDPDGLVIDGGGKLWRWNPEEKTAAPKAIVDLPPGLFPAGMIRVMEGEMEGSVLLNGSYAARTTKPDDTRATIFILAPGTEAFKPVDLGGVEHLAATPAIANGLTVFGGSGDLYQGDLAKPSANSESNGGLLWGMRTAPLAAGGDGVREVAIAGGLVWAIVGRQIVSLPPAPSFPADHEPGYAGSLQVLRDSLAALKIVPLPDAAKPHLGIDHLCGWSGRDGAWKIAFCVDSSTFWLLEKGTAEPSLIGTELTLGR